MGSLSIYLENLDVSIEAEKFVIKAAYKALLVFILDKRSTFKGQSFSIKSNSDSSIRLVFKSIYFSYPGIILS